MTAPGSPFAPLARARIPFSPPDPDFCPFPLWATDSFRALPYLSWAPRLSFAAGDPAAAAATKAPAPPPLRQPGRPVPIWLITALPGHEQQQLPPPPPLEQGASSPAVARRSAAHANKQSPARADSRRDADGGWKGGRNLAVPARDRPYPPSTLGNSKVGDRLGSAVGRLLAGLPPCAPPPLVSLWGQTRPEPGELGTASQAKRNANPLKAKRPCVQAGDSLAPKEKKHVVKFNTTREGKHTHTFLRCSITYG